MAGHAAEAEGRPLRAERLVLREVRLPLREPFEISSGATTDRRILLLELTGAEGTTAWSECVAGEAPNYSPETVDTAWWAVREWLAPRIMGRELASAREAAGVLGRGIRGHRMARAAVEMGLWELEARRAGVSLSRLLGGTRDRVATGISLGIQPSPGKLAARVRAAAREGYRRVKVKIRPGADRESLAAAREALGEERGEGAGGEEGSPPPLTADANAAYRPEDADRLAGLAEFGLSMLEQPLEAGDLLRHADLQRRVPFPLCLDESIDTPGRAEDTMRLEAARIVNVKPGRVGGFAPALAIHDVCVEAGAPVWCGGMLETGIGRGHNVALASLPGFSLPGDLSPSRRYWEEDIVTPEWTMDADGMVTVPTDRAGTGVEVERERVEKLTVRQEELTG